MLRIMEGNATNDSMTLRLDGSLISHWVEVLRSSCEQAFTHRDELILDLAGVSFADREGVELLQQLQPRVTFINCSPFLREQIGQSSSYLPGAPTSE